MNKDLKKNIKEIDNSDLMELLKLDHELVVRLYNWITNLQKENEHLRTQVNTNIDIIDGGDEE